MQLPWFIWNGRDSRSMNVTLERFPDRSGAALYAEEVTVPGRSGTLRLAGTERCGCSLLTLRLLVLPGTAAGTVLAWLRGSGELILGTEPDRVCFARVTGEVRLRPVADGWLAGAVSFRVQPGRGQTPPEGVITVTQAAVPVHNPGDLTARPAYRLYGSGRMWLRIAGSGLCVDLREAEDAPGGAVIDTDAMTVTDPDGTRSLAEFTGLTGSGIAGLWIPPHATVTVDAGFSDAEGETERVEITPRWRWV